MQYLSVVRALRVELLLLAVMAACLAALTLPSVSYAVLGGSVSQIARATTAPASGQTP